MGNEVTVRSPEKVRLDAEIVIQKIYLKYSKTDDFYVDLELARKIITFISLLKHTGGKLGGVNFQLLPFQVEFTVETLAVIQRRNGYRKHKTSILFVPRKQGKTELLAAMNLWLFFGDKEKQKEQYVIASETTQASILYAAIVSMLKQSPPLAKRVQIFKAERKIQTTKGTFIDLFRVLSAIAGTKDGLKGSCLTADEAHAYPDSALYDVMTESMAHREQPLSILISTAGYNKQGFFHRTLLYARQVMEGIIKDPSIYLMDFSLEDDEDWTKEENWVKCNPALGYGVKMDYLRDKFQKAQYSASDEVSFKTKHLCIFTDAAVTWIKSKDWEASATTQYTEEDLLGQECYAGLDLASTTDLAAFVLVFPQPDKTFKVLCRFFVPKENAMSRSKVDKVSYLDWIREKYITATEGNVIDYEVIENTIRADMEKFDLKEIAFDRWNSHALVTNLEQDGALMVGFGQGFQSMSSPVKEIEALVLQKRLDHGNNPVLTWNIANCVTVSDAADNVKLDKSKAQEKIDGAVALTMAVGRASVHIDDTPDVDSLIG